MPAPCGSRTIRRMSRVSVVEIRLWRPNSAGERGSINPIHLAGAEARQERRIQTVDPSMMITALEGSLTVSPGLVFRIGNRTAAAPLPPRSSRSSHRSTNCYRRLRSFKIQLALVVARVWSDRRNNYPSPAETDASPGKAVGSTAGARTSSFRRTTACDQHSRIRSSNRRSVGRSRLFSVVQCLGTRMTSRPRPCSMASFTCRHPAGSGAPANGRIPERSPRVSDIPVGQEFVGKVPARKTQYETGSVRCSGIF